MDDAQGKSGAELPTLTMTDRAADRIRGVRQRQGHPEAWVSVTPAGLVGEQLSFTFALVESGGLKDDEVLVRGRDDIDFVAPKLISRHVIGATVDADPLTGALELKTSYNPDADPLAQAVQELLDREINPAVASHGGYIGLLDVADGVAYVQMGGGCQGCGLAEVTLSQGVRTTILERFPELHDVVDTTDHAQGANPYYQASKK
jgi:Fe/S biogenesis protein NfuA